MPLENGQAAGQIKRPEWTLEVLLNEGAEGFQDHFETQRIDFGRAQRLRSFVCAESKKGVSLLGEGKEIEAQTVYEECVTAFRELCSALPSAREVNIPTDKAWELQSDAGQELTEFIIVLKFFPMLVGKTDATSLNLPTFEMLGVTPQAWLNGIADAASEMEKLTGDIVTNKLFGDDEEIIYLRCLDAVKAISHFLGQFATCYPLMLDATRRRGQGFTSKRRTVAMAQVRINEKIMNIRLHKKNLDEITDLKKMISELVTAREV